MIPEYYNNLQEANNARQAEWDQDNKLTLLFHGNELAEEVGEVCGVIKKLERERLGLKGSRKTIDDLAEELSDVVIVAYLVARKAGINLDAAIVTKFNATSIKLGFNTRLGV